MTLQEPRRPDPDALLQEAQRAERGRLKVFLGMSPGVGKTYEMLVQAARREGQGGGVLVGVVETHGRAETQALLKGLEVLPRRPLQHRGRTLMEFDIDAALARRPGLLLVDELAHSNVTGSRHPKRWQDVEELLAAGIDVWTTLNVQHLESLVDVVWKITGVRQRETVPDSVLSGAEDIEVVDITPGELRKRLEEGKVYLPETARQAAVHFFRPENLTALRELALRRAAQTIDDQLVGAMRRAGVEGPWAAGERVVVLIGADAMAPALVRAGRRLSEMMDAPWTVLHVERPSRPAVGAAAARVGEALKLAEQLGGQTQMLEGEDIVGLVLDYAQRHNATQIVLGKGRDSRLREVFGRSLAGAFTRRARGAALHIVTEAGAPAAAPALPGVGRAIARGWRGYLVGAAFVAAATGVSFVLDRTLERANVGMVFLSAVLAAGVLYGLRTALAAATAAFLVYNFFFLEPRYSFQINSTDVLTLLVFWAAALATGGLAGRLRDQRQALARRAAAVTTLLAASRRLSATARQQDTAQALAEQLSAATGGKAMVLLPRDDSIAPAAASPALEELSAGDITAARWAWDKGEPAGAGTATLPNAAWTFHPLQGIKARSGVAAIEAGAGSSSPDDARFVTALLDQGAVALERAELAAAAADAEALRRSDKLRAALLNSISHDLRTPLSTVLGSTTTLLDYGEGLEPKVRRDLLESVREEAERLNHYVGDLLDMTRIEGGALAPRREWLDPRDVLTAALNRVSRRLEDRRVDKDFPPQLSLVKGDAGLLEQALVNILENAIAYSPDGTTIELAAYEDLRNVVLSIEDEGRGIPTAELEQVFEKFRRMEQSGDRGKGAGLGLAISKGFVEAMGGRIAAASPIHEGRGTRVLISLPKETATAPGLL